LVEQAELQREIVGEVVQLEEPYRSTILLRFFENLSAGDIARKQGVAVSAKDIRPGICLWTCTEMS
jgi:DNA-directed RNA polymerase specialized sigma24 family protein